MRAAAILVAAVLALLIAAPPTVARVQMTVGAAPSKFTLRVSRGTAAVDAGVSEMAPATERKPRSAIGSVIEFAATAAVAVGLALVIETFVVKPYTIPSTSMVPTLIRGQRVLVNRLDTSPSLGEIVVFHPPSGAIAQPPVRRPRPGSRPPAACDRPTAQESTQTFIKRVVGLPGDRISIIDGHVIRNGVPENAPTRNRAVGDPTAPSPRPSPSPPATTS